MKKKTRTKTKTKTKAKLKKPNVGMLAAVELVAAARATVREWRSTRVYPIVSFTRLEKALEPFK